MTSILPFLKELISVPGLTGYESPVSDLIAASWRPLSDELHTSRLGSLHALKRGQAPAPRPSILLAAHMDAIGLMVASVEGEFLRLVSIGGIDPRVLPGQLVTVHGRRDLPGVIVQPPAHLLPPDKRSGPSVISNLLVDTGQSARVVKQQVRAGDLISFATSPTEMEGGHLYGHSLDNRASVAALTTCLQELQNRTLAWDVWAVATVQEEITTAGAATSAFQLRPTLAIAVDVTFGSGPGSPSHESFPLNRGPTLGWGPNIHPGLYARFEKLAADLEMSCSLEVMPRRSGTDADLMQLSAEGIATMALGIPIRYIHTPVEIVTIKDITRTGRLLAEFIAQLDETTMDQLTAEVE